MVQELFDFANRNVELYHRTMKAQAEIDRLPFPKTRSAGMAGALMAVCATFLTLSAGTGIALCDNDSRSIVATAAGLCALVTAFLATIYFWQGARIVFKRRSEFRRNIRLTTIYRTVFTLAIFIILSEVVLESTVAIAFGSRAYLEYQVVVDFFMIVLCNNRMQTIVRSYWNDLGDRKPATT